MAAEADVIYRNKATVLAGMLADILTRIPDFWTDIDGTGRLFFEIIAGQHEGLYQAAELLRDNIFIQRAGLVELRLHGEMWALAIKQGTPSTGVLQLSGRGGVFIPAGSTVVADPGTGDALFFVTTEDATIPDPGTPTAPVIADSGSSGNPVAGLYEYVVTFLTDTGETLPGPESNALTLSASHRINVTGIAIGGPGTTGRRLYRQRDGLGYELVTTINDNTTTTYNDNQLESALGGSPAGISTAENVVVAGASEENGAIYNAAIGAINEVAEVPDGVTDVTNISVFAGGSDEEDMEHFRSRLLEWVRNPRTGSLGDLESWAEEIDGVESATAFKNENMGTPQNGHVTVRIVGPDATAPPSDVIDAVQAHLDEKDVANITIHVTTFTLVPTNVSVTLTLVAGYVLADVTPAVQDAITNYINNQPVGAPVYRAGLYDAVYGDIPGVATLEVTNPDATTGDLLTANTEKRSAGVISVS